jgi:hypothetical protein
METPWKIAETRTLKWGSSPPRAEEGSGLAAVCSNFADFLIDFGAKIDISVLMPRKHSSVVRQLREGNIISASSDS